MNIMFQKKAGRSLTWKRSKGVAKTEIDYILTNMRDIATDVTVINQANIGSYHRMVTSHIMLNVEV